MIVRVRQQLLLGLFAPMVWLAAPVLHADGHPNTAAGLAGSADKPFQVGEIDQINLYNGSVTLTIGLGRPYRAGGSLAYGLAAIYNSNFWTSADGDVQAYAHDVPGHAGLGWAVSLGSLLAPITPGNNSPHPKYRGPDGSETTLYPTLHAEDPEDAGDGGLTQYTRYSRNGTYLRLKQDPATGVRELEFPDGMVHRFDSLGRPTQIRDRFGNTLHVIYGPLRWTLSDGFRTHRVHFRHINQDGRSVEAVDRIELAAFTPPGSSPAFAEYRFLYEAATIPRPSHRNPPFQDLASVTFLTAIVLPDGSTYRMGLEGYVTDPPAATGWRSSGAIRRVTLPTRGALEWTYQDYVFPNHSSPIPFQTRTAGVATRRTLDAGGAALGTWAYATSLTDSRTDLVNTVTDPLGHRTVRYFTTVKSPEYSLPFTRGTTDATGTRFLSTEVYDSAGTKLRSTFVRYELDRPVSPEPSDVADLTAVNPREASRRIVYHDDGDRFADLSHGDFDGLGNYRATRTDGNFAAGNERISFRWFNPGNSTYPDSFVMRPADAPWLLRLVGFEWVSEGGQTAAVTRTLDLNTGWTSRTRVHRLATGADSEQDVIMEALADGHGNLSSERYYGGDTQPVPTGNLAAIPLSQPQYRIDHTYAYGTRTTSTYIDSAGVPLPFKALDQDVDPSTGLVSARRDTAGVVTSFDYDPMGRPRLIKPTNDASTEFRYLPAPPGGRAKVEVLRRSNAGAILTQAESSFDGLGRQVQTRELMPAGWSVSERAYNTAGLTDWVSEKGAPASRTYFSNYDPFGRPTRIVPPDGGDHAVTLAYKGVSELARRVLVGTTFDAGSETVMETPTWTTEFYDRQGRLHRVREEANPDRSNTTTTYSYDVGNRLSRVRQQTAAGTQNRFFTYDMRGFLLSESHPEKVGAVTYSSYDARGHARARNDGSFRLGYTFDEAERLTEIHEASAGRLKAFRYGAPGDPCGLCNGKLYQASRFNKVQLGTFTHIAEIRHSLNYSGRDGRLSERVTEHVLNDSLAARISQGWTYDPLGNVTHVDYPAFLFGHCPYQVGWVDRSYDKGYLVGGNYLGSISYHLDGTVRSVAHPNGITDTIERDPSGLSRPLRITATHATGTRWRTGDYSYDGAGNVTRMGSSYFVYDGVSRLSQAHLFTDPLGAFSVVDQGFSYDGFGNLQGITGAAGRPTRTVSTTNRLEGAQYDTAGNLTDWNGQHFEHDAFGLVQRHCTTTPCGSAGGEEWRHIYDADDERIFSYRPGNPQTRWTLRDIDNTILRQYTFTNATNTCTLDRGYVYRDGLLAAEGLSETYYSLDHLRTPRLATNRFGYQTAFHTYFPFGEEATSPFQDSERIKFTGHERDLNVTAGTQPQSDDVDYMHARHYSPLLGRFLSPDRRRGTAREPQSFNAFSYVQGNPVTFIDPDGRERLPAWAETLWEHGGTGSLALVAAFNPGTTGAAVAAGLAYPVYEINVALNEMSFDLGPIHVRPESGRGLRILAPPLGYIWDLGEWALFRGLYGPEIGLVRTTITVTDAEGRPVGPPFISFYPPDTFIGMSPEQLQRLELWEKFPQSNAGGQLVSVYLSYTPPPK